MKSERDAIKLLEKAAARFSKAMIERKKLAQKATDASQTDIANEHSLAALAALRAHGDVIQTKVVYEQTLAKHNIET
ncbi:hypothetical protein HY008_01000 [Candidatus Woesebacteria bacterium]|nr:hypothetical protein [Candidatus Woesebacteria bacterium]